MEIPGRLMIASHCSSVTCCCFFVFVMVTLNTLTMACKTNKCIVPLYASGSLGMNQFQKQSSLLFLWLPMTSIASPGFFFKFRFQLQTANTKMAGNKISTGRLTISYPIKTILLGKGNLRYTWIGFGSCKKSWNERSAVSP